MCLNCGCGEPETRHQETDITMDDVRKASAGKPVEQTIQNMHDSLDKMGQGHGGQMSGSGSQSTMGGSGSQSTPGGSGSQSTPGGRTDTGGRTEG